MKQNDNIEIRSIEGIPCNYILRRSARRTISAEITAEGNLLVRAPYSMGEQMIADFLLSHRRWIQNHLSRPRLEEPTAEEKEELIRRAKTELPPLVQYYSRIMGLVPGKMRITGAKTRYGSCSGRNNICFSWRLMRYPKEAVEYVVVHELAHIRHKNHGKDFYALIEQVLPDYKERKKLLR